MTAAFAANGVDAVSGFQSLATGLGWNIPTDMIGRKPYRQMMLSSAKEVLNRSLQYVSDLLNKRGAYVGGKNGLVVSADGWYQQRQNSSHIAVTIMDAAAPEGSAGLILVAIAQSRGDKSQRVKH